MKNEIFKALIFDSLFDDYKGVIAYVRVLSGELKSDEKLSLFNSNTTFNSIEIGYFTPNRIPTDIIQSGEVGYIATGLRSVRDVRVGDTIFHTKEKHNPELKPYPGYKAPKPVIFAGLFPVDQSDYTNFKKALDELVLNDAGIFLENTRSNTLGQGFRAGFLGMLHLEVVQERLTREYEMDVIITSPTVKTKIITTKNEEKIIDNPNDLPEPNYIQEILEPMTETRIYVTNDYYGKVNQLVSENKGIIERVKKLDDKRMELICTIPLLKLISGFFNDLKSVSSGFASMNYKITNYRSTNIVKMSILVHGEPIEAFESLVYQDEAREQGKLICEKLKDLIPRHLFKIPIQASIGSNVIARTDISAMRKDVTAKLYGGDQTRKDKLLKKQKKGKERLKKFGKVSIPKEVFLKVITEKNNI